MPHYYMTRGLDLHEAGIYPECGCETLRNVGLVYFDKRQIRRRAGVWCKKVFFPNGVYGRLRTARKSKGVWKYNRNK